MSWIYEALCRGIDTEMFYPEKGQGSSYESKLILRMCSQCPVKINCLEVALRSEEGHGRGYGIWGGTTPNQRKKILKQRAVGG